jgi:hypothetical protein
MKSRRASWLLLMIAFVVALAHICALPSHSYAEGVPAHSDDGADGMHAASCDAVRPVPTAVPMPVVVASLPLRIERLDATTVTTSRTLVLPTASPPLFLLHSSLLI